MSTTQYRIFSWIKGWAFLVEGLVLVLTLGFIDLGLIGKLFTWRDNYMVSIFRKSEKKWTKD